MAALKPSESSEKQSIEQLQARYNDLNNKKIRAEADLANAKKELESLKKKAREKYQTDDVAELQELLARMKAENEEKRKSYQAQLDTIESELAEVEKKFAPVTSLLPVPTLQKGKGCTDPEASSLPAPANARRLADRLLDKREERERRSLDMAKEFAELNAYLAIAGDVTLALEQLGQQLFQQLLETVQAKLTIALQEILEQPIRFKAVADFKRGSATVEFSVERDGKEEDLLRGQGGSVHNIISVGLRMFALTTLDESRHRRFLVLDEQDCWLRPDLVPRLVKIVHDAGQASGFSGPDDQPSRCGLSSSAMRSESISSFPMAKAVLRFALSPIIPANLTARAK